MKKLFKITYLIFFVFFTVSCITTKPAKTLKKAEKNIIKYNKGIQNQIRFYPELVKKAYTVQEIITINVPGDSLKLTLLLQEIDSLKNIKLNIDNNLTELDSNIDEILIVTNDTLDLNLYKSQITNLLQRVKLLNKENTKLFEKYNSLSTMTQMGTYEDSLYQIDYIFENGSLSLDIKNKDKVVKTIVDKEVYDISIKKRFWEDFYFWILFFIFLFFYFFKPKIKTYLNKTFTKLK